MARPRLLTPSASKSLGRASGLGSLLIAAWFSVSAAWAEPPDLVAQDMTFVASRGEVNEVVLRAETARFLTGESKVAHLEKVHAVVAESEDRVGFEMRCDAGELDLVTNDFYAEGNVEGETDEGRVFSAPWVRYDHAKSLLFTDAAVVITEDTGKFEGGGFRYFVKERRFRLLGGATVLQEQ